MVSDEHRATTRSSERSWLGERCPTCGTHIAWRLTVDGQPIALDFDPGTKPGDAYINMDGRVVPLGTNPPPPGHYVYLVHAHLHLLHACPVTERQGVLL